MRLERKGTHFGRRTAKVSGAREAGSSPLVPFPQMEGKRRQAKNRRFHNVTRGLATRLLISTLFALALLTACGARVRAGVRVVRHGVPEDCLMGAKVTGEVNLQGALNLIRADLEQMGACGFVLARLDSAVLHRSEMDTVLALYYSPGPRVEVKEVRFHVRTETGETVDPAPGGTTRKPLPLGELPEALHRLQRSLLDSGRPFFLASVDSVFVGPSGLELAVSVEPGPEVRIGRLEFAGDVRTSPSLLSRYAGIRLGDRFRVRDVERAARRLERLPYVAGVGGWSLALDDAGGGVLQFRLRARSANRLDGVVGYMPGTPSGRGYVVGSLDLDVVDLFGTGRGLRIYWNRKDRWSEEAELSFAEPFVWKLPIGLQAQLRQRVQDSTYVQRGLGLTLLTNVAATWKLKLEARREWVSPGRAGGSVPSSRTIWLGVGFEIDQRDDPFTPRRGVLYHNVVRQAERRYEGLPRSRDQEVELDLETYLPLGRAQVLAWQGHLRTLCTGKGAIPASEMYRLGGSRTLRGYREDQFVGASVAWSNLEYRLIFGELSWVFAFLDAGYIDRRPQGKALLRFGYGLGLRMRTAVGQLGFDIGLGQGDSLPSAKVHVRLVTSF